MRRRQILTASALALAGCAAPDEISGGFTGMAHERGHLLREALAPLAPAPKITRRVHTLILGGGVAGLAAARALRQRGRDDFALLELEDSAGGNSRSSTLHGIACPQGAHYLPTPGDDAYEVQDLLEELGVRHRVAGRWQYDERHLCHSPQERLFFNGEWQDGLLPTQGVGHATLAQYQRFADAVSRLQGVARFTMPMLRSPLSDLHRELDAITFETWLQREGLHDPHLRWYLDYCCRDDYGAGSATVSAWAGLHYFASRHGFHAPATEIDGEGGGERGSEPSTVLTWPEGNGWLTRQLAAPLGDRLQTGRVVLRIEAGRHGVTVDAFNAATQSRERWQAQTSIVALPLFVATRVLAQPPELLRQAAAERAYAPWLVANLHLRAPLHDRPGAPPSWDNVLYQSPGLGYVDAQHQSLAPVPGPTVLSYYLALGELANGRAQLLQRPWQHWRDAILAELSLPHPDLAAKTTRIDITRYGHAMTIPQPGTAKLWALTPRSGVPRHERLLLAHSDWSGYSVFEEAFTRGHLAGLAA